MCTEALFKIVNVLNQPRCNPIDEFIKIWYTHTMEFYSAIKKNGIMALERKIDTNRHHQT